MVKRILIIFILLVISLFVVKTPLYSQDLVSDTPLTTYEEVYGDYVLSSDEYNKAHEEYLLRRSQYLNFQSLKSKQDAFQATKSMLEKRDNVVISYLKVLEIKLQEGVGISDDRKTGLFLKINDEVNWLINHRDNLSTSGSLEDLVSDSDLAANRWDNINPLALEIMSVLSQGKITRVSNRLDKVFAELKDKLETIREDQREGYSFSLSKFQFLDRWVFEADGRIVRSKEKQNEADVLLTDRTKTGLDEVTYNLLVTKLTEARLYLNESISFLEEILEQVKVEEQ